jgi:hypothetical protein
VKHNEKMKQAFEFPYVGLNPDFSSPNSAHWLWNALQTIAITDSLLVKKFK